MNSSNYRGELLQAYSSRWPPLNLEYFAVGVLHIHLQNVYALLTVEYSVAERAAGLMKDAERGWSQMLMFEWAWCNTVAFCWDMLRPNVENPLYDGTILITVALLDFVKEILRLSTASTMYCVVRLLCWYDWKYSTFCANRWLQEICITNNVFRQALLEFYSRLKIWWVVVISCICKN